MTIRTTKRCPRCCPPGVELPADRFPPCRSRGDGLQSYCRQCYRARQRESHRRSGDRRRQAVRRISIAARARNRALLLAYLADHPCVDCGITDVRVLEFHHVSGKTKTISALVTHGYNWARAEREIARCVVLCANCHRIRETELRGTFRSSRARKGCVREPAEAYVFRRLRRLGTPTAAWPLARLAYREYGGLSVDLRAPER